LGGARVAHRYVIARKGGTVISRLGEILTRLRAGASRKRKQARPHPEGAGPVPLTPEDRRALTVARLVETRNLLMPLLEWFSSGAFPSADRLRKAWQEFEHEIRTFAKGKPSVRKPPGLQSVRDKKVHHLLAGGR
jgi:hypothetical protein